MPVYEYKCGLCETLFTVRHSNYEPPDIKPCPKCKGKSKRVFSIPSVIYKAEGFYTTDSRKEVK